MVEKNVAYNRDNRSEDFADNDPLAQLARLVAQEDRPAHVAPPVASSPAGRREPEFNLEDELLREFAIYDAPRHEPIALDPANDVRATVPANEFLQRVESVFSRREPELEQAPEPQSQPEAAFEPVEQYAPAESEEYLIAEHATPTTAYSDLRNDFSDDPESVAALFDVNHRGVQPQIEEPIYRDVAEPIHQPVAEPVYQEPVAQHAAEVEPVQHYVEPAAPVQQEYVPQPAAVEPLQQPDWEQMAETSGEAAIDLASELEMSVADVPAPVAPVAPSVRRSSLEFSSLRLPLANFGATRATPVAPRPAAPVAATPAPAPIEAAPVQPAPVPAPPVQYAEAPVSHVEPPVPAGQAMSAMDELIYDVAKYEISNKSVSAAEPSAHMEPVATAAPVVAPVVQVAAKPAPQPVRTEPSFVAPVASPAPVADDFDAFKDEDFELALDDIDFDIDLSEIANIDVPAAPVTTPVAVAAPAPVAPAPVQPRPVAATPVVAAPAVAVAPSAPRPQPQAVAAPVARQEAPRPAAPVAPVPDAGLDSLPFDPTQIGETEDAPETITEMEVPELPVGVFEPKPAPRRHEEDLDIDTELAALFSPAASGGLDRHKGAEGKAAERQPQPTQDEVDEFERALEQDFRRSMQEAAETRATSAHAAAPANVGQQVRYQDEDRGNGRRWFVPMAAAVGLVLVGGGTYALMFGGSSGQGSSGAPVIISADNEPTKVVPENPGGRVVPNQDKAVYDRVAGGQPSAPTQPALISTNEEPVDVVQRTLIPEQLPLEDEADQMQGGTSTPVGETEDPRLLSPDEQQAQNSTGNSGVGVSPRKVRTMIVKPDGTLVAQEVPEPVPAAPQADRVEQLAAPQPAQSGEGAPAVIATSRVPVAPQQPAQPQQAAPATTQTAAPMPASRPAPAAQPTATAAAPTAPVRPAPPSQPAQETAAAPTPATNASSSGGYYIQIASLPSQADAQKSYQNLSTKFSSVIGGRGVDIKAAEIAGKGTFYRVRIPAGDKNEAAALCERFRSAGGSCLIAR